MTQKSFSLYPPGAFVTALQSSLLGAFLFLLVCLAALGVGLSRSGESISFVNFVSGIIAIAGFAGLVGMIALLPTAILLPPLATLISLFGDHNSSPMKSLQYVSGMFVGSAVGYWILDLIAAQSPPFPNWSWIWPGMIWGLASSFVWRRKMLNRSNGNFERDTGFENDGACV